MGCAGPTSRSAPNICARRAKRTIRLAKTTTRPCPASCTAIPTAFCSCRPGSVRPTAATARARAWSARPAATITSPAASGIRALAYIEAHTEIRDVLISGGDPLTIADDKLDYLLGRLRAIKHIEFVRLGTKVPTVLPMRVTKSLTRNPEEAPPAVDEYPLHAPERTDAGGHGSDGTAGRCRHSAGLTNGAARRHQRQRRDHEDALSRAAEAPGETLLSLPVRPDHGVVALPHAGLARASRSSRACAVTRPAMRCRSM